MKYKNIALKIFSMALVACVSFAPISVLANPTDENTEVVEDVAEEQKAYPEDAIILSTVEDILVLAENCVLDTWSIGKTVVLNNDIDMSGVEFESIPTFGGTFLGQGYKITGLSMEHEASVVGFFRYVQKKAVIDNLHIEAEILPAGTSKIVGGIAGSNAGTIKNSTFTGEVAGKEQIGGIAGYNRAMGVIENCTAKGIVHGNHIIGGVVGKNEGVIRQTTNEAEVNTKSEHNTIGMDLTGVSVESIVGFESVDYATELGGIAGKSSGVIRECYNKANVGYRKMGYNIGGIVGTQNGYIVDSINYGDIEGANGVGGIAGQFMPSIVLDFGPDPVKTMDSKMNSVMNSMEDLTNTVDEETAYLNDDAKSMKDAMDALEASKSPDTGLYDLDTLYAAVNSMSMSLGNMYNKTSQKQNEGQTSGVPAKMDHLMNEMEDMMNTVETLEAGIEFNDTSRKDKVQDTIGKIASSENYGRVSGTTAVGGVAGMLDIENNANQDDVKVNGETSVNGEGEIRLVVRDCKNYGTVAANKNYAGGIAGHMVVGAIFDCKNIGNLDALNANYVGGIAGSCETVIFDSISKSIIAGANYVGGIAGYAAEVTGCYSFVDMLAYDEFAGTVIGSSKELPGEGEKLISNNTYFINGTDIGGIDGVTYAGATDRISLDDFLALEDLDDMYKHVQVRFIADGQPEVVMTVNVGKSIKYETIPTVSVAETNIYDWVLRKPVTYETLAMGEEEEIIYVSDARLSNILFDQTYEASYERKYMVTQGDERTEDNKSVILAIGAFEKNTKVSLKDALATETVVQGKKVFENWEVIISNRGIEKLHYRIPEGKEAKEIRLYIKNNLGSWEERDFTVEGSFMVFDFTAEDSGFALAEKFVVNPVYIVSLLAVGAIAGFVGYKKKSKKK